MKKEYTLAQAKQDCIDMWDWLRNHPDKNKDDYFGIDFWLDYPIRHGCPMCEYTKVGTYYSNCRICPMWPDSDYGCEMSDSPYYKWCNTNSVTNKRIYATEVLKLALQIKVTECEVTP